MNLRYPIDALLQAGGSVRERHGAGYGAVYTRSWVAELILDLSRYDPSRNLVDALCVEPSCGNGEFLEPMIRRLSESCRRQGRALRDCSGSIRAFELDAGSASSSKSRAKATLLGCGWDEAEIQAVVDHWIRQTDFLLDPEIEMTGKLGGGVDFVIGNPPYIRLESIDPSVARHYRKLFKTMSGRADIYVGFYEKALELLKPGGVCGFICADRWMLNQYGSSLRRFVTEGFSVEAVIEMHDTGAFQDEVLAYPAVTIIRRAEQGKTLVARMDSSWDASNTEGLVRTALNIQKEPQVDDEPGPQTDGSVVVDEWFRGSAPWPCVTPERLKLLKYLEANFPPLEDNSTGTRVGIGVATGADKVFITSDPELVEKDRLLPLAMAGDTFSGTLEWSGHCLVDPWASDGTLVNLESYPMLKRFFETKEGVLRQRHVARRNPERWFRTIDKVNHPLTVKPKLLIPDIKNTAHPVFDSGEFYPHHNLYYVTSEVWDLKALGGLLLSKIGQFFIECYAVRMHGGYLRFQAQYLRRVRVPHPEMVDAEHTSKLSDAFENRDVEEATRVALEVYGLDHLPD